IEQRRFYNPHHHRKFPRQLRGRPPVHLRLRHLNNYSSPEECFHMKKVVLASLLAVAAAVPVAQLGYAQAAAPAQSAGGVQMSAEEYAAYNNANTQSTPAGKAAAFESYLKAYPQSAVKEDVLQQLLFAYSQAQDSTKALDAADRLLQGNPTNFRALVFEVSLRRAAADQVTDPAAKQTGLDAAADYARKGL